MENMAGEFQRFFAEQTSQFWIFIRPWATIMFIDIQRKSLIWTNGTPLGHFQIFKYNSSTVDFRSKLEITVVFFKNEKIKKLKKVPFGEILMFFKSGLMESKFTQL